MRLSLLVLSAVLAASARAVEPGDPLKSPGCLQALAALDAHQSASREAAQAGPARQAADVRVPPGLQSLRTAAARHCLGSRMDPPAPPPPRTQQPAISVAPVTIPLPPRPHAAPPAAAPAVLVPALKSVVSCDALGCWASDGTRLQRQGQQLIGPQGACRAQGAVLSCP